MKFNQAICDGPEGGARRRFGHRVGERLLRIIASDDNNEKRGFLFMKSCRILGAFLVLFLVAGLEVESFAVPSFLTVMINESVFWISNTNSASATYSGGLIEENTAFTAIAYADAFVTKGNPIVARGAVNFYARLKIEGFTTDTVNVSIASSLPSVLDVGGASAEASILASLRLFHSPNDPTSYSTNNMPSDHVTEIFNSSEAVEVFGGTVERRSVDERTAGFKMNPGEIIHIWGSLDANAIANSVDSYSESYSNLFRFTVKVETVDTAVPEQGSSLILLFLSLSALGIMRYSCVRRAT